ncbi:MAG: N-acetylneuraminate synthase family protein [Magnetococcales bacterium]|nr:N-acetylneuraminate synthase family protein [Magnetococcales bacterium]
MLISMGDRQVGAGEPVYLVFEAGPTHYGLESAMTLATMAKEAGADAIKFQIADHKRLITTKDLPFSYGILTDRDSGTIETVTEPLIDIWERRFLSRDEWSSLKAHCDTLGINFFATVFFEEDVEFLTELGVHSFKIASQDIAHMDLIRYCAGKQIPIQIDTGNATIGEVERAVDWIRDEGNEKIIINHCPSGYPARTESINLRVIRTLKEMFPYPVAFSDHTPGWEMDIAARALGADIIEKTITLDRTIRSCEHVMSLEPPEMPVFIKAMRELEIALGNSRCIVTQEARDSRESVRRSGFLVRPVKKGERLQRSDFDLRRPGHGVLKTDDYFHYLGRTFSRDLPTEHMVTVDDLE